MSSPFAPAAVIKRAENENKIELPLSDAGGIDKVELSPITGRIRSHPYAMTFRARDDYFTVYEKRAVFDRRRTVRKHSRGAIASLAAVSPALNLVMPRGYTALASA